MSFGGFYIGIFTGVPAKKYVDFSPEVASAGSGESLFGAPEQLQQYPLLDVVVLVDRRRQRVCYAIVNVRLLRQ